MLRPNLEGAKYTLAVSNSLADAGLKDFADIAKFGDQLDHTIYGIEPGNDGNRLILDMIEKDAFGLGDFALKESSEQAMLAAGQARREGGEGIVFLGWEPHPMNATVKMTYLTGGDDFFGPNFGGATVYTNVRKGYRRGVPERRQVPVEPRVHPADGERDHGQHPRRRREPGRRGGGVARGQPRHPRRLARGVTTRDGGDGLAAVRAALGV